MEINARNKLLLLQCLHIFKEYASAINHFPDNMTNSFKYKHTCVMTTSHFHQIYTPQSKYNASNVNTQYVSGLLKPEE